MLDYIMLAPKIEVLTKQVMGVAEAVDASNATIAAVLNALEARVAELERRTAPGFHLGVVTASGGPPKLVACPKCGAPEVAPTGNILMSMPPQTEMRCGVCENHWGVP